MAKNRLEKALQGKNISAMYGNNRGADDQWSYDDFLRYAYDNRVLEEADGGTAMTRKGARSKIIAQLGIDMFDARSLIPNPNNTYHITEGDIESLADQIYVSKNTTPLVLRETEEGIQIIDGERRTKAHLLLGERYGEHWYMLPARCFKLGALSDEDALFILHAENIGQRAMLPTERAEGFAAISDRLVALRAEEPERYMGTRTVDILAEQMGVSSRLAAMEVNIGKNLCPEGKKLFNEGRITKKGADALAGLSEVEQQTLINDLLSGSLDKEDVAQTARGMKNTPRSVSTRTNVPKDTDTLLGEARRILKRAVARRGAADRVVIAECRNLLDQLDPDKEHS